MSYRLVIGDKNISSWSLRPWLAMRQAGLPFQEINIKLRQPESPADILRYSPSGKVPALLTQKQVIWDSLAIIEFLAEERVGVTISIDGPEELQDKFRVFNNGMGSYAMAAPRSKALLQRHRSRIADLAQHVHRNRRRAAHLLTM